MKTLLFRRNLAIAVLFLSCFIYSCKPDDSKISESVKANTTAIDPGVNVAVNGGVVTLSGPVKNRDVYDAVANSAKNVKGVKSVVNNMVVASSAVDINPDNLIRADISENFLQMGIRGVDFTVANGVVTLSGQVTKADMVKAVQAANESNPRKVNNQLKIVN